MWTPIPAVPPRGLRAAIFAMFSATQHPAPHNPPKHLGMKRKLTIRRYEKVFRLNKTKLNTKKNALGWAGHGLSRGGHAYPSHFWSLHPPQPWCSPFIWPLSRGATGNQGFQSLIYSTWSLPLCYNDSTHDPFFSTSVDCSLTWYTPYLTHTLWASTHTLTDFYPDTK